MGRREIQRPIQEKKQEKKKKKRIGLKIFLFILLIFVLAGVYFGYRTMKNGGGMQGMIATLVGHNENTLKNLEPIHFLVMGESTDIPLTDTMMVCSYNPKDQTAAILSIPRDTFTGKNKNTATAYQKINTAYKGGDDPENAVKVINEITGLDIKYYVLIDTKALRDLVDEINGVWFDVPIDMKYDDTSQDLHINLKAGYQLLDGDKAEQLVRFRHNNDGSTYSYDYGTEDIGRMKTQREFITEVLKQTLKPENIFKIGNFVEIAHKNVKTNAPLSVVKDYIPYAVNFKTENLKTASLPGQPELCNEVWLFIHNKKQTKELIDEMFLGIVKEEENTNSINNTVNTVNSNKTTNSTSNTTSVKNTSR